MGQHVRMPEAAIILPLFAPSHLTRVHALCCHYADCLLAQVERFPLFLPMGEHGSARA